MGQEVERETRRREGKRRMKLWMKEEKDEKIRKKELGSTNGEDRKRK